MLVSHVLKQGPGPLFVFLHGFLGNSWDWKEVCAHLPDSWHCIGMDLPGHGDSVFTEDFLGKFPVFREKMHLVGYSMGGRLAMQVAAHFPDRVATLALCSAHPGLSEESERKKRLEHDRKWTAKLRRLSIDAFLKEWYDQPIFNGFRPERTFGDRKSLARSLMHYSLARLPFVETNALAIVGEQDEKFRKLWKSSEIVPKAGHAVHLENPKAVAEILRTFHVCLETRSTIHRHQIRKDGGNCKNHHQSA